MNTVIRTQKKFFKASDRVLLFTASPKLTGTVRRIIDPPFNSGRDVQVDLDNGQTVVAGRWELELIRE